MATAIARRFGVGKKILLGIPDPEKLEKNAEALRRSGYDVVTKAVNAMDKDSIETFAVMTHESSGQASSERDLRKTCPGARFGRSLAVHGGSVAGAEAEVAAWAKANLQ